MATRFRKQHSPSRFAILTDTAGVHLVTPQGTITSRYAASIRHQAAYGPLIKHLQTKNGWTPQVSALINWKAHGSSLHARIDTRTHFIKLVHGILPTAKQVHRHDPIRNTCSRCKNAVEDWVHILVCQHVTRQEWRVEFLEHLECEGKILNTRPIILKVLLDAVRGWFARPDDDYHIDPGQYPPEVRRLIHHQNLIGWKQVFLGRFSSAWSNVQDDFYAQKIQSNDSPKRRTGQRWQISIISIIWKQWQLLWSQRNHNLHGKDETQQQRALTQTIRRDIYDVASQLEPSVRALLHADISTHLEKPNWFNQNWLAIHAPLIKASLKRAREKAIVGVKSIRQYFGQR